MTTSTTFIDCRDVALPRRGRNGVIPRAPIERLLAKTRPNAETGCVEWTGSVTQKGYATIAIGCLIAPGAKRKILAHRLAYVAAKGPIPDGLTIDHLCRNKRCCNPDHMEPVTVQENSRRAARDRAATAATSPTRTPPAGSILSGREK